jgi:DNA-binding transcriptional regulator GbsR (MarR family)
MPVSREPFDESVQKTAAAMGAVFHMLGQPSIAGRIWTVLYLHEHPLDMPEIRRVLGISSGAASMGMNELLAVGLAHREVAPGSRRFAYRAETDLWQIARHLFRNRQRPALLIPLDQIRAVERSLAVAPCQTEPARFMLERIQTLTRIGSFSLDLLDAFAARTRVELKAARKWLSVSERLGGEPLSRIRKRLNRKD